MWMYCSTNDKTIPNENPVPLTLGESFLEIDNLPSIEEYYDYPNDSPFIGFQNKKDDVIQFSFNDRGKDLWSIDIPIIYEEKFILTIEQNLSKQEVRNVVTLFFEGCSNVDSLFKTERHMLSLKDEIESIRSVESEISQEVMDSHYLLVNNSSNVWCQIYIEDYNSSESFLSNLEKKYSLKRFSIKELFDT